MINLIMVDYYAKRATEYERIYLKPERQKDLRELQEKITGSFAGLDLLEIACGTGFWTQFACRSARTIVATDCNEEVLNIAREKEYCSSHVTFLKSDAYVLDEVIGPFSGALVCFWWSHVPKTKLRNFLHTLHSKLSIGARVIMLDNRYVEGSSTALSRTDFDANTYQTRHLSDGSMHEVLKNFPARDELVEQIGPFSETFECTELEYFWMVEYTLKEAK